MGNLLTDSELFIFDLDGTLYEDTDHFEYYAEQLKQELPEALWPEFSKVYEKIVAGEHIVTIGKVYDVLRDHVLKVDSMDSTVIQAWKWTGVELEENEVRTLYPHPISFDFDSMIAIGDGWWLPNVCARHYGVVDTHTSYVKTKNFMATDQFQLTKIPGLREALLNLREKKQLVLLTNSQEDDVHRLLQLLDLVGIFKEVITEARKPQYTKNHFARLLEHYQISPEKVLSIGDNYVNEIAPAIHLQMQTIFIDFFELDYPEYTGVKVKSISDIIMEMKSV
ncbi:HAD family hydrolase [Bacillaceae bacterium S4-13-58]